MNDKFLGLSKGQLVKLVAVLFALVTLVNTATLVYSLRESSKRQEKIESIAVEAHSHAQENLRLNCSLASHADSRVKDTEDLLASDLVGAHPQLYTTLEVRLKSDKQLARLYTTLDCGT